MGCCTDLIDILRNPNKLSALANIWGLLLITWAFGTTFRSEAFTQIKNQENYEEIKYLSFTEMLFQKTNTIGWLIQNSLYDQRNSHYQLSNGFSRTKLLD